MSPLYTTNVPIASGNKDITPTYAPLSCELVLLPPWSFAGLQQLFDPPSPRPFRLHWVRPPPASSHILYIPAVPFRCPYNNNCVHPLLAFLLPLPLLAVKHSNPFFFPPVGLLASCVPATVLQPTFSGPRVQWSVRAHNHPSTRKPIFTIN